MSAASIFFVCLYGSHCIVMLDELTWRAALVSTSVCRDCRSFTKHCSPDQHFQLVSGDSKQLCFTGRVPAIFHLPAVICSEKSAKLLACLLQRALHQCIQTVQLWYGLQKVMLSLCTVPYILKHDMQCAAVTCLPCRSNSDSLQ